MKQQTLHTETLCRILFFAVACANVFLNGVANGQNGGALADQRFVEGLISRGLFSSASRFCETQQRLAKDSQSQVFWLLKQTRIRQQEAWLGASGGGRGGLIGLTIQEIEEVLQKTPEAGLQFDLQIRQLELTADAIRMSLQVGEGGHVFGRFRQVESARPLLSRDSNSIKAALKSLDAAIRQARDLRQQLEKYRKQLGFQTSQTIKESIALVTAELEVLKYRTLRTTNADTENQFQIANQQIKTSTPSVRQKLRQQHLKWLQAELSLWSDRPDTTQLLIASANQSESGPYRPTQLLTARLELFRQDTNAARRALLTWRPSREEHRQAKNWLLLECFLGDFELAEQLQDSSLKAQAASEFSHHFHQANFSGVAADSAHRCAEWFEMVRTTGHKTAVEIERIDRSRADDPEGSLQQIQALLNRLPADRTRTIALLSSKSGKLLVAQKQWVRAEQALKVAAKHFDASTQRKQQAEADLLRLFSVAQQIRTNNDPDLQHRYLAELKRHLLEYPDQPTSKTVSKWLSSVQSQTDPLIAIQTLLQSAKSGPILSLNDLKQAAALLIRFDAKNESDRQRAEVAAAELQSLFAECQQVKGRFTELQLRALEADSLMLAARQANADDTTWLSIRDRLRRLQQAVTDAEKETEFHCQILAAAVIANTFSRSSEQENLQQMLADLKVIEAGFALNYLLRTVTVGQRHSNRIWLAKALLPIAEARFQNAETMETQLQQLRTLQQLAVVAGQSEIYEPALVQVLNQPLTASDRRRLAGFLAERMGSAQQLARFWIDMAEQEPKGSDLWLESQLQLALIASQSGRKAQALKRLQVVGAIYADWGTAERKQRALNALNAAGD